MRRILMVPTVAALMAAMMVAIAMPAFAAAKSPEANCIDELANHQEPENKGQVVCHEAPNSDSKGVGEEAKSFATEIPPKDYTCNERL